MMIRLHTVVGAALALTATSVLATGKKQTERIYFCLGKSIYPSGDGEKKRRYGVKVVEGHRDGESAASGTISIRAYDTPDQNAAFRLERGEVERLQISRVSQGGVSEGCAKYGWDAFSRKYLAVMCTATQGVADIEISDKAAGRLVFRAECDHVWVD